MTREVDLASYLPSFMRTYKEPVEALKSEDPEFEVMWDAADKVLRNRFIATADEYGISRFEAMLGIYPDDRDTIESRRLKIQNKWFNKLPYTWKALIQRLVILCNDTGFVLAHDFEMGYTLFLETELELYGWVEELERLLMIMLPCNIAVEAKNSIIIETEGNIMTAGGVCFVETLFITNDFNEKVNIRGENAIGSGMAICDLIVVET